MPTFYNCAKSPKEVLQKWIDIYKRSNDDGKLMESDLQVAVASECIALIKTIAKDLGYEIK